MDVIIASDHAGVDLKALLIEHIVERGLKYVDMGTDDSNDSVDYPDFAQRVCEVFMHSFSGFGCLDSTIGILICGTGIGMSIAANRYLGIRCALAVTEDMAKYARLHNDANVVALGARIINADMAIAIVDTFIDTGYEGDRHDARLQKLDRLI
jgi:ribose 5-phosphate isomerase B